MNEYYGHNLPELSPPIDDLEIHAITFLRQALTVEIDKEANQLRLYVGGVLVTDLNLTELVGTEEGADDLDHLSLMIDDYLLEEFRFRSALDPSEAGFETPTGAFVSVDTLIRVSGDLHSADLVAWAGNAAQLEVCGEEIDKWCKEVDSYLETLVERGHLPEAAEAHLTDILSKSVAHDTEKEVAARDLPIEGGCPECPSCHECHQDASCDDYHCEDATTDNYHHCIKCEENPDIPLEEAVEAILAWD